MPTDDARRIAGPGETSAGWDLYRALRDQWTHEDDVMNHRLMWLILSQGLLFTAYGLLSRTSHRWLGVGFPFFGMAVAGIIGVSIFAAVEAAMTVERQFEKAGLDVLCSLAPGGRTVSRGRWAAKTLPFVFAALWVFVLAAAL